MSPEQTIINENATLLEELTGMSQAMKEGRAYLRGSDQDPAFQTPQPSATTPKPEEPEGPGVVKETYRATVGGVTDAVLEGGRAVSEFLEWSNRVSPFSPYFWMTRGEEGQKLAAETQAQLEGSYDASKDIQEKFVGENETTVGKVGRNITTFAVPFIAGMRSLASVGNASKLATFGKASAVGAAVDAGAFDPQEARLANLVMEWSENDPAFGKAFFEYMMAQPGDTNAEGRLKNALEGLVLGTALEGVFMGVRAMKGTITGRGEKDPIKVLEDAAQQDRTLNGSAVARNDDIYEIEINGVAGDDVKAPRTPDEVDAGSLPSNLDLDRPRQVDTREQGDEVLERAPRTEDAPNVDPVEITEAVIKRTEEAITKGNGFKVWLDPDEDVGFVFGAKRPSHEHRDFDKAVSRTLSKDPSEYGRGDFKILRAYANLQRRALNEGAESEAARALDSIMRAAPEQLESAKEAISEVAEDIRFEIAQNAKALKDKGLALQQGGFVSPTLLANILAGTAGGMAGAATAPEGATPAERLTRGLTFAAAAMGATSAAVAVGKRVMGLKQIAESDAARKAADATTSRALTKPEVSGIAPVKGPVVKETPTKPQRADPEGVEDVAKRITSGELDLDSTIDDAFNFQNIETDADLDDIVRVFDQRFAAKMDAARGGKPVQTLGEMEKLAASLDTDVDTLGELYKGTDNLPARVLRARTIMNASLRKVTEMAQAATKATGEEATAAQLALRKQIAIHAMVQAKMKGVQTEIARALTSFRITSRSASMARAEMDALIESLGGSATNAKLAKMLTEVADPDQINRFAARLNQRSLWAKTWDALYEVWINSLLGGAATHVVNALGNGMVTVANSVERALAAGFGAVRGGTDRAYSHEVFDQARGILEGITDTLHVSQAGRGELMEAAKLYAKGDRAAAEALILKSGNIGDAWKAYITDVPQLDTASASSKEAVAQIGGLSSTAFGVNPRSMGGRAMDFTSALHRATGSKLLGMSDEVFKTANYRAEVRALSYRRARQEGLTGGAANLRAAELASNPPPDIAEAALETARVATFTNRLGEAGTRLQALHGVPGVRWVMPFIRTPLNLLHWAGRRTPGLNMAYKTVREDLAAGGARRDMVLARTAVGTALIAAVFDMTDKGLITGFGDGNNSAEQLAGRQTFSLKVGDKYYSLSRMDPLGFFIGIGATLQQVYKHGTMEEADEIASAFMLGTQQMLINRTYLSGLVQAMAAAHDTERYGERFVQHFISSWVPNSIGQFKKITDPTMKEVWSIADAVTARIPGMSQEVPPRVNAFGQEIKVGTGEWWEPLSFSRMTTENPTPLAQAIADLNIDLGRPPKTLSVEGAVEGVELEPWEYHQYVKTAGEIFSRNGAKLFNSSKFRDMVERAKNDPNAKDYLLEPQMQIKNTYYKALAEARNRMIADNKRIQTDLRLRRMNVGRARKGEELLQLGQ